VESHGAAARRQASPPIPGPSADAAQPACRLGEIPLSSPFLLAPMAGYTDRSFRRICRELGAGLVYTELASADGLYYGGRKTWEILESDDRERPLGAQLFGVDTDRLVHAAREIGKTGRFDLVDLNMGCPVRKIVRRGAGAAMLRDPGLVESYVARLVGAVDLPITAKLRTEWEPGDGAGLAAARAAERGGATAVAMHARGRRRRHRGAADLDALARVREELRIPVIGNGGIRVARDALEMMRRTGVAAVMIARGALGYPWIFREAVALSRGREIGRPSLEERRAMILRHYDLTLEAYATRSRRNPEFAASVHFRKHAIAYFQRLPGYTEFAPRVRLLVDRDSTRREIEQQLVSIETARHGKASSDTTPR
jgi:nifR3 family TIM-barrel protein